MTRFIFALFCAITSSSVALGAAVVNVPQATNLTEETTEQRDARMHWWREARFGMFIHFGLYAIPAGEWEGRKTPRIGEWIMHDLEIPPGQYATLANQFNPTKFDAANIAAVAKDAGMKYIVITSKHHDGFALFRSRYSDYNISKTPFKRDIMMEMAQATRSAGLQICWYHSILDWHDPDARNDETFAQYEWRMRGQVSELLSNYGPIGIMWFDGEWTKPWNDVRGESLYKLCRSLQPNVIVNNRVGKQREGMNGFTRAGGFSGDYATPEQQIPDDVPAGADWETCMTMNDTWGYRKDDFNFKSSRELIRDLIDVASKGGNFLLNIGPTAAGEIPPQSIDRLRDMGKWMRVNGESIYGTTASPFAKLPWGRATIKPEKLYLHVFDWPSSGTLIVPMRNKPTKAYPLAEPGKAIEFSNGADGVTLSVGKGDSDSDATVLVVEISPGSVDVIRPATAPATTTSTTTRATTTRATTTASTHPAATMTATKPATTRTASTQAAGNK